MTVVVERGFEGKVAIVTGSTGGIGKSIALQLGAAGASVVINGRNEEEGTAVVRAVRQSGGDAIFVRADVTSKEQSVGLVDSAIERFGHVDIMVASAGPGTARNASGKLSQSSTLFVESDPDDVVESLVRSTRMKLNPVHAVVKHMIARGGGSILFVTSQGGRVPTPGQTALSLHAGGLLMMNKVVAKELARSKIRMNALAVTLVEDTPAWTRFTEGEMTPVKTKVFEKIRKQAPFGLAKPEDVAEVACFLVSDAARFVTGETVSAVGGSSFS